MLVKRALKAGTFSMRHLAEEGGISYGVLRAWASGRRTPEPDNLHRLANGLEARADRLRGLAKELRDAAGGTDG